MGTDHLKSRRARPHPLVTLAALAIAVFVWLTGPVGAGTQPPPGPTPPAFTQAEADNILRQLGSGDEAQLRDAVALPPDQPLDRDAVTQLQSLAGLTIDAMTFRLERDDVATASATWQRPGAGPSRWMVRLVHTDERWKIAFTEQMP